jgi:hypothetical protein
LPAVERFRVLGLSRVAQAVSAAAGAAACVGYGMSVETLPRVVSPGPHVHTARAFLHDFKPIESIADGLPVPRGGLVGCTGPTGHGKTTVTALMQVAIAENTRFAGREVSAGAVLVLAGENADDYAMHLMATLQDAGIEPSSRLLIVPGTFPILNHVDHIERLLGMAGIDNLVAVFVDTSAAYYMAEDENDNVAMRHHASVLRELTTLPGKPCVIVLCHPTKNATRDNLLPRGGGAFLAEIDANLTVWKDDSGIVSLHWAGKIRGPSFDPLRFELVPIELAGKLDCRGKPIYSVAARHIPDERAEQLQAKDGDDEDVLMVAMQRNPGASLRVLATKCGWTSGTMKPLSARVERRMHALERHGLVEQDRKGKWTLTTKGQKEADKLP